MTALPPSPDRRPMMATEARRMIRVREAGVYATREAALTAGYPDAECGWWVPQNCDPSLASEGWLALEYESDD